MSNCYPTRGCGNMTGGMQQPGYDSNTGFDCPCYLAIVNVPMQRFRTIYEPARALQCGTAFPELDKPFTGRSVRKI